MEIKSIPISCDGPENCRVEALAEKISGLENQLYICDRLIPLSLGLGLGLDPSLVETRRNLLMQSGLLHNRIDREVCETCVYRQI